MDNSIFIHKYKGSSWDLGLAMGKPYMISVIGVNDFGDSDLLSLKSKSN
jgi:large subunit ribosomal protein L30e